MSQLLRDKTTPDELDHSAGRLAEVDALVVPVIPEPAPTLETAKAGSVDDVVTRMGRFSRLTRPFNALGLPALTVPCGFSSDGRPLALMSQVRKT